MPQSNGKSFNHETPLQMSSKNPKRSFATTNPHEAMETLDNLKWSVYRRCSRPNNKTQQHNKYHHHHNQSQTLSENTYTRETPNLTRIKTGDNSTTTLNEFSPFSSQCQQNSANKKTLNAPNDYFQSFFSDMFFSLSFCITCNITKCNRIHL